MRISITGKICFILLMVFSLVIISTTLYQAVRERELIEKLSTEQAKAQLDNYRFGIDLIIKNGDQVSQNQFHQAFSHLPHVTQVKWIQAESQPDIGAVTPASLPSDETEKAALTGKSLSSFERKGGIAHLTVIEPYYLPKDLKHPVAAIKIVYSLDAQLELVEKHIFFYAILLSAIFGIVLVMALIITRKYIVEPLQQLRVAIDNVTDLDDTSARLPVRFNDEISQLNASFNDMMDHIEQQRKAVTTQDSQPNHFD